MGLKWKNKDVEYLKQNYKVKSNVEMALFLGRTASAVKRKMYEQSIRRDALELHKIRSHIAKRPNAGQFKKGRLPHNARYDGCARITKDGYVEVRLDAGIFKLKHLYRWELLNGPLPSGCCLRCIDGNLQNTNPGNWRLITRIENMLLNSKTVYPKQIIPTMIARCKLNNKLKELING
jgi:hypothetical protein